MGLLGGLLACGSSGTAAQVDAGPIADATLEGDAPLQDGVSSGDGEGSAPMAEGGSVVADAQSDGPVSSADADSAALDDGEVSETGADVDSALGDGAGNSDGGRDAASDADAGMAISVVFSIDVSKGPTRQFARPATPAPVSPYIYGIHGLGSFVQQKTRWGLIRKGGNTYSDWNWTNNYLNAGATFCFWQGQADGGGALAGAVTQGGDSIGAAQAKGEAYLATVPIGEHVAAAFDNDTHAAGLCPVTASDCYGGMGPSTGVNTKQLDFVSSDPSSTAFVANAAVKPGAFCACAPGEACDGGCSVSSNPVYQDEFVNYIKNNFGSAGAAPVFFDLDNEPNYWGGVHPEIWPFTGTLPCPTASISYDDILSRDKRFAAAVKNAWPSAKVFGPVVSQDGMIYAHSYDKDAHYPVEFLDYYLGGMAMASASAGTSLLDVVDLHYYNLRGSAAQQCVQNPRMFWDPNDTAVSASDTDQIDFAWSGLDNYFDTNWYPRRIIPRIQAKIAAAYPSGGPAAPGLSFSEYNSGCEAEIAGAIAEADDLGVFGREGVFAATVLPAQSLTNNYLVAAFDLYRNYDGNGAVVGDLAVGAGTTNVDTASVYAFAHSDDPNAIDIVAINKASSDVSATISITTTSPLSKAALYHIVDGNAAVVPASSATPAVTCAGGVCALGYTMPALSATTIVLR